MDSLFCVQETLFPVLKNKILYTRKHMPHKNFPFITTSQKRFITITLTPCRWGAPHIHRPLSEGPHIFTGLKYSQTSTVSHISYPVVHFIGLQHLVLLCFKNVSLAPRMNFFWKPECLGITMTKITLNPLFLFLIF